VPLRSAIGNCEAVGCLTSATRFAIELLTECRTKNTPFFSNATMTAIRSRRFATTQWSIVKAAAGKSSAAAKTALENLCTTYWTPVYAFVRQRGYSQPDAEDLTQAFFMHLLDSDFLQTADRDRGRFRSFLLKSVSNFLSVDRRKRDTEKRGGQIRILALDFRTGESAYQSEALVNATPEQLFERQWALTLLQNTINQLRSEYAERNHLRLFESLEAHINQNSSRVPYAELCETLNMSEDAIKQAARRLKLRYREILRSEIAATVGSAEHIDAELRELIAVLSR
jgi:RNA polymerase sigma factor (sigma-70 family)